VTVEDLDSVNGTFVNGRKITRSRLSDGDELKLDEMALQVRVLSAGG
jgi:pSer/pThr/pTyr-binding forkhead associated (FHA) protein